MSAELTARKRTPSRRGLGRCNSMSFPRELRQAIPELHGGRMLELSQINGRAVDSPLFGPMVMLKLVLQETGKLSGEYVVRLDLLPEAASELAATLTRLVADLTPKVL